VSADRREIDELAAALLLHHWQSGRDSMENTANVHIDMTVRGQREVHKYLHILKAGHIKSAEVRGLAVLRISLVSDSRRSVRRAPRTTNALRL